MRAFAWIALLQPGSNGKIIRVGLGWPLCPMFFNTNLLSLWNKRAQAGLLKGSSVRQRGDDRVTHITWGYFSRCAWQLSAPLEVAAALNALLKRPFLGRWHFPFSSRRAEPEKQINLLSVSLFKRYPCPYKHLRFHYATPQKLRLRWATLQYRLEHSQSIA